MTPGYRGERMRKMSGGCKILYRSENVFFSNSLQPDKADPARISTGRGFACCPQGSGSLNLEIQSICCVGPLAPRQEHLPSC